MLRLAPYIPTEVPKNVKDMVAFALWLKVKLLCEYLAVGPNVKHYPLHENYAYLSADESAEVPDVQLVE